MLTIDGPVFILGSSGFANEINSYLKETKDINCIFVDDNNKAVLSISEFHKTVEKIKVSYVILGSGKPQTKIKMIKDARGKFISAIHPTSWSHFARMGQGIVVAPNAVIGNKSIIGDHVLINYLASIGHESKIGNFSSIGPNAAIGGWCEIGIGVYVGAGAAIREKLVIGDGAVIAMGAVLTKNVPDNHIAVGNPAITMSLEEWKLKKSKKGWFYD